MRRLKKNQYLRSVIRQKQLKLNKKIMILKGFIKVVGQTRDWTNKDGEARQSVKLELAIPYVGKDGQEYYDELLGEMTVPNKEFLAVLKKACEARERCEMHVGFSLSEWQGKKIQNIRVYNLTKLMM